MHLIIIEGPGQAESNVNGIKLEADNYERAVSAVVDYLETRDEVDPDRIALLGVSFGSFWGFRAAAHEPRFAAHVSLWASICDKHRLMNVESPRYKQLFAYLTQAESEEELDEVVARMTTDDRAPHISMPSLLTIGEYDPRSPLEEVQAIYDLMTCDRELWVHEDQHHNNTPYGHQGTTNRSHWDSDSYWIALDWIRDRLEGKPIRNSGEVTWLRPGGPGPVGADPVLARSWLDTVPEDEWKRGPSED
jgi:dipeptidyl aminopeptidase/acylaminoacyl peptidase